jgi:hypothetical protein
VLLVVRPLATGSSDEPLVRVALLLVIVAGFQAMQRERILPGIAILLGAPVLIALYAAATLPALPAPVIDSLLPLSFFVFFTSSSPGPCSPATR